MPSEAIQALERGIKLHELTSSAAGTRGSDIMASGVSCVGQDQMALERTGIMKILAEELIKNGQVEKGIVVAQEALVAQKVFFSNMMNHQVQETMLLLAEAHTVNNAASEALKVYQEILDERSGNFGALAGEPVKDINRKMAPLLTQLENYSAAAACLQSVIAEETQDILKVGLYTKMAGNYKKADMEDESIKASKDAYELMLQLSNANDPQTCRCQLNLAQVYQYFEKTDEAKDCYSKFLTLYEELDLESESQQGIQMAKLRDFAQLQINAIDGVEEQEEEGEEEYYDEEDPKDEAAEADADADAPESEAPEGEVPVVQDPKDEAHKEEDPVDEDSKDEMPEGEAPEAEAEAPENEAV